MTMTLLSLLLGCFNQPVAVVVQWSPGDGEKRQERPEPCGQTGLELASVGISKDHTSTAKNIVERCCTNNGGEHVGWQKARRDSDYHYPVCLYR
jgi:hypothetical protein